MHVHQCGQVKKYMRGKNVLNHPKPGRAAPKADLLCVLLLDRYPPRNLHSIISEFVLIYYSQGPSTLSCPAAPQMMV